jgi:predicted NBD/HSP70 family sugar kinase
MGGVTSDSVPVGHGGAAGVGPVSAPATAGEVFQLIRTGVADTRSAVGRATGLSRTAISARLALLLAAGLVVEGAEGSSTGGRPAATLRFDHRSGVVLAGAIGRSRTQLAVCDLYGEVLAGADLDQEPGSVPEDLMPALVKRLGELLGDVGLTGADVRGVGLSIPGTVDRTRGVSLDSPIMPGWNGVDLAPYLRSLTDADVRVDNDTNVMALSERQAVGGHLGTYDDVLLVKASTGVGAGIVLDGELRRGALGAAGEIGHTKTAPGRGMICRCGDIGCLETVAGGWALVQAMRDQGREVDHVRSLVALANDGDPEARRLVRESGRRVGEVLAAAVNLLNPAAVVVGGDMVLAYDTFAAGLRETLYGAATALATRELQILPATHGDRAGVVGCAALALDHVLSVEAVDRLVASL